MAVLGLLVGSFLNVVILRLPQALFPADPLATPPSLASIFYQLSAPGSHCPHCHTPIAMRYNIPLLGFIWLRGRCARCAAPISWQYPAVESWTALSFASLSLIWGAQAPLGWWCIFMAFLIPLAAIDWRTFYLPDILTLLLLALGLLGSAWGDLQAFPQALGGALLGFAVLWLLRQLFSLLLQQEAMGLGDLKLVAALGAWLGMQALPSLLLMASILGLTLGWGLQRWQTRGPVRQIPFGPFLALAALWPSLIKPLLQRVTA